MLYHMEHEGYLTEERHWEQLAKLLEEGKQRGMSVWIYDEDGFPSGPAGGRALAGHPEGEARGLYYSFAFIERGGRARLEMPRGLPVYVKAAPVSAGALELGNALDVSGSVREGVLEWGPMDQALDWGTPDRDRWLLMVFSEDILYERTFAAFSKLKPPYHMINLMDEKAVGEFIRLTHERYHRRCKPYFGSVIPGFFTDEPCLLTFQDEKMPTSAVPWHQRFPEWFEEKHGYDIVQWLPALYHDCGPRTRKVRCDYFEVLTEKVESSYHKQLGEWCARHGVMSSGHLLLEERLHWHARFQGDYMRCLRHMQQPGIDVLSSKSELTRPHENMLGGALLLGAKFCSSVKHHYRRERSLSETSNYQQGLKKLATSFEDVRATLSWQYALGIDTIVSFYGKGPFEPERWNELNDYAGRLGLMLTGGRHVCDIAVFYPIKSQWANFIRQNNELSEEDSRLQQKLDADFVELSMALIERQLDFDYLHQEQLMEARIEDGRLHVADESYGVLVLPPMDTEDAAVIAKASRFAEAGGVVIVAGRLPKHSPDGHDRAARKTVKSLMQMRGGRVREAAGFDELPAAIDELTPPDVAVSPPSRRLIALHRRKGGAEAESTVDIYFVFNNSAEPWRGEIGFSAEGNPEIWDPLDGSIGPAGARTDPAADVSPEPRSEASGSMVELEIQGYAGTLIVFGSSGACL